MFSWWTKYYLHLHTTVQWTSELARKIWAGDLRHMRHSFVFFWVAAQVTLCAGADRSVSFFQTLPLRFCERILRNHTQLVASERGLLDRRPRFYWKVPHVYNVFITAECYRCAMLCTCVWTSHNHCAPAQADIVTLVRRAPTRTIYIQQNSSQTLEERSVKSTYIATEISWKMRGCPLVYKNRGQLMQTRKFWMYILRSMICTLDTVHHPRYISYTCTRC
jgi:hypothetical protein